MNKLEKKKLIEKYKNHQKQIFEKSLPMDRELFFKLFDYLDERLEIRKCNHDFSLTEEFFKDKDIDITKVLEFLEENGGYCDCEVIFNVEEKFEE